jgi:DNA (cytosine-5)-methyltransferase 1
MLVNGMAIVVDESRNHQLRQVGNGVVPAQAAVAFVVLARRAGILINAIKEAA